MRNTPLPTPFFRLGAFDEEALEAEHSKNLVLRDERNRIQRRHLRLLALVLLVLLVLLLVLLLLLLLLLLRW